MAILIFSIGPVIILPGSARNFDFGMDLFQMIGNKFMCWILRLKFYYKAFLQIALILAEKVWHLSPPE